MNGQHHAPAALTLEKELVGKRGWVDAIASMGPPGFEPRIIQPVKFAIPSMLSQLPR